MRRENTGPGAGGWAPTLWQVVLCAGLLQLPLVLAPGYFSHDELQWAVWADAHQDVRWDDGGTTFQYRPLTFTVWMALSRALFAHPHAYHAVFVAWGTVHAGALYALLRRAGLAARPAACAAVLFVASPYAVFVHGWVATLADLLWTACALMLAAVVLRATRALPLAVAACALTAIALLAKEAAAAIPVLCVVAAGFDSTRRRRWIAAASGGAVAVAVFLAWRLPALLNAPRLPRYLPSVVNLPARWIEYQVFLPLVPVQEVQATFLRPVPAAIAVVMWIAALVALVGARRGLAALWLVGGAAALGPVLLLGESANQYGYAFAMVSAACFAAGWAAARTRRTRHVLAVFALLTMLHGGVVMARMLTVARVQAVFSPALAQVLRTRTGEVRLRLASGAKPWIFQRLTHEIPAYAGVPIGDRVRLVATGEPADFVVEADGRLQPVH